MGEVVGAGIVSHVPTIMLPEETRRELNEGKEISLVPGFHRLREEVLDVLKPDTFIVFDTHCATLLEFFVPSHERREGKFTSEELPRGMCQVPYDMKGSPALAALMAPGESAIASIMTSASVTPRPAPPTSSGMAMPSQPPSAIARRNALGKAPLASCSAQ